MGQFVSRENLLTYIKEEKANNHRIVATNGCFDILHKGHLDYLLKAKSLGDLLVVGINSDESVKQLKGPTRPINNELDRAALVAALTCVDYTFIFSEQTAEAFLLELKPDLYVKGGDYTIENLPEAAVIKQINADVFFVPVTKGKSTTGIIEKMLNPD